MTVEISKVLTEFVRPSEHSTFSPSGADRWMTCPFSIRASVGIPDSTSKAALEGTLAHQVCEDYFRHIHYGVPKSAELMMANEEMMDAARQWYDVLTGWSRRPEIGKVLYFGLERGIPIFPGKGCFGTADGVIIGDKGCAILDFKYGRRAVSAESTQLKLYLLGVFRNLSGYQCSAPIDYSFNAVVVQPRTDDLPKHHTYTYLNMHNFSPVVVQAIALATNAPDLSPVEGRHCYFCPARNPADPIKECPAITGKKIKVAGEKFDSLLSDMNAPVERVGAVNLKRDKAIIKIMSLLPLMKQIAEDGEAEFTARLGKGEVIPGVQIVQKPGNRMWAHDEAEITRRLKALYPETETHRTIPATTKLKTLTVIEKEVGKNNFDNSLTIKKIKKTLVVGEKTVADILGDMTNYGKMIGLNIGG